MNPEDWRGWSSAAPAWSIRFFLEDADDLELEALDQLVDRAADTSELRGLLEAVDRKDLRVTLTIERRGE